MGTDPLEEVTAACVAECPAPLLEAMASQVVAMREARRLIALDGLMVRDGKQNPVPHPCLEIERQAQKTLDGLIRAWVRR